MDEHDDEFRQFSKTRRSVDAYPDFQSANQTHRLLDGRCYVYYFMLLRQTLISAQQAAINFAQFRLPNHNFDRIILG